MRRSILALAVFLAVAGCSGERTPTGPRTPSGEAPAPQPREEGTAGRSGTILEIEPAEVRKGTPVRLSAAGFPLEGAVVEWLVNGKAVPGTLDAGTLKKGDTLQARVEGPSGTALSRIVTVRNSPPEIRSVRFVTPDGREGSPLALETEPYDADGDAVQVDIDWKVNGKPAGTGNRLEVPVRRGDKVTVTITPTDGEEAGRSASLTREIRNMPPAIEGHEGFQVEGNVVTFLVKASDRDGDPLRFSLKDAQPGMRIDPASGRVRWEMPPGTSGKIPFTVAVSDGAGGETSARIHLTIREETPPETR
jgi:translation initiation factor IF-1